MVTFWVKTQSKEQEKALDVRFCHKKLEIYLFIAIWNGNHGTLILSNTDECQKNQIKNLVDPI